MHAAHPLPRPAVVGTNSKSCCLALSPEQLPEQLSLSCSMRAQMQMAVWWQLLWTTEQALERLKLCRWRIARPSRMVHKALHADWQPCTWISMLYLIYWLDDSGW